MGLLDKVKAQATQAAQKASEAGKAGQAKLESAQAQRKVEALFRDLGAAVYAERTGKAQVSQPGTEPTSIEGLIEEIQQLEAEHGDAAVATAPTARADQAATGSPGGNFTLDG